MFVCRKILLMLAAMLTLQAAVASEPASAPPQTPQAIPFKQDKTPTEDGLPRMALGLVVCGALFAVAIVLLRKRYGLAANSAGAKRNLRIVESQRVTPKSSLHVVEFRGTYYLLGQSEAGLRRLASSPVETSLQAGETE